MRKLFRYIRSTIQVVLFVSILGMVLLAVMTGPYFPLVVAGLLVRLTAYTVSEPSFFAEFRADMEVNGHSVQLRRILECRPGKARRAIALQDYKLFRRIDVPLVKNVGAIGTRLPDGSAVMMQIPYFCDTEMVKDARGVERRVPKAIPSKTIPLMAWTPNADTMETLEIYMTRKYFSEPYARIKVKHMAVLPAPRARRAAPPDEFAWFTAGRRSAHPITTGKRYSFATTVAVVVDIDAIEPSDQRYGEDRQFFDSLDAFTALKRRDIGPGYRKLIPQIPHYTSSTGFNYWNPYSEKLEAVHGNIHPVIFEKDEKIFKILWDRNGYTIARNQDLDSYIRFKEAVGITGQNGSVYPVNITYVGLYFYFNNERKLVNLYGGSEQFK